VLETLRMYGIRNFGAVRCYVPDRISERSPWVRGALGEIGGTLYVGAEIYKKVLSYEWKVINE